MAQILRLHTKVSVYIMLYLLSTLKMVQWNELACFALELGVSKKFCIIQKLEYSGFIISFCLLPKYFYFSFFLSSPKAVSKAPCSVFISIWSRIVYFKSYCLSTRIFKGIFMLCVILGSFASKCRIPTLPNHSSFAVMTKHIVSGFEQTHCSAQREVFLSKFTSHQF